MEKKTINKILIIIGLIGVLICLYLLSQGNPDKIVYYYGQGCPHCQNVENFLNENKIEEKIFFEKKEVYYNQENIQELVKRAKSCGMNSKEIPVPFLWNGSNCIIGDEAIINFFKEKIK